MLIILLITLVALLLKAKEVDSQVMEDSILKEIWQQIMVLLRIRQWVQQKAWIKE